MVPPDRRVDTTHFTARLRVTVAAVAVTAAAGLALTACGSGTSQTQGGNNGARVVSEKGEQPSAQATIRPRLVLGDPVPGLAFTVSSEDPAPLRSPAAGVDVAGPSSGDAQPNANRPRDAAAAFGQAIVAGRIDEAFALLPDIEQERMGSAVKFAEVLGREPAWLSSSVDTNATESVDQPRTATTDVVALKVTETPAVDEILGVVGPTAIVRLPTRKEPDGWRVSWERRSVTQQYRATDERLKTDVTAWATARQHCRPAESGTPPTAYPGEPANGLFGAVWLATALCENQDGTITPTAIGDIYTLADPQPLLDAYGSGAYDWARVVTLAEPHAMHVIAAPLEDHWVVIGVAPIPASS